MATITTDLICNLNQPVAATFLHGNLFSQDNAGNTINVHVMDNGEPATIGGTVSANVIRADGNTVAVSGSLSGNQCSVVLPQACYAVPGRVEIIIKLTQSTTITTIAAIVANVYRSTTDTVVDPGTIIPSIQALIEEIEDAVDSIPVDYSGLLATIAANYSSSKTYQVGQYAWQGGVLKRCIVPITTAETYTAAHWTNAVIGDDLSALKSAIDYKNVGFEIVSGHYINESGLDRTSGSGSRSVPIPVTKDSVIEFTAKGYNVNIAMISTSDQGGTTFKAKVICTDSNERTYKYTVEEDGYIVVSYINSGSHDLVIKGPISNAALNNRVKVIENSNVVLLAEEVDMTIPAQDQAITVAQDGKYITNNGNLSSANVLELSAEITLEKGQTIKFNAIGYLTNVSVLARVNTNGTYTPLIISEDSNEHTFTYFASYGMKVVISSNKSITPKYTIIASVIGELKSAVEAKDYVAFATMGVIGDSLASGASNYVGGVADRPVYSWGKYIEREHGIAVSLFSTGGATTRSWLSGSFGLQALNAADVLDCYIIGLGVNDAYSLGIDYLGSISDVHVGDESQNADTYYGNYSKIIAAIKAKSPRAKIMCLTNPMGTSETGIAFNEAVEDIVDLYDDTYLIDLTEDEYYKSPEYKETLYSTHSTAVGYKLIAQNLYGHINDVIQENVKDFLDIQWIVNNHP